MLPEFWPGNYILFRTTHLSLLLRMFCRENYYELKAQPEAAEHPEIFGVFFGLVYRQNSPDKIQPKHPEDIINPGA